MRKRVLFSWIIVFSLFSHFVIAQSTTKKDDRILSAPGGRFVLGQISDFRQDQYLLDTQTGRLWQIVESKGGGSKLQPVKYIQIFGDELYTPEPDIEVEKIEKFLREKSFKDYIKEMQDQMTDSVKDSSSKN